VTQHIYWFSNQTPYTVYFDNSQSAPDATSAQPFQAVMTGGANGDYCNVPDCSGQQYFYQYHMTLFGVDVENDNTVVFAVMFWANDYQSEVLQYSLNGAYFNVKDVTLGGTINEGDPFGMVLSYDSDSGPDITAVPGAAPPQGAGAG
jgi:hypothetical protein